MYHTVLICFWTSLSRFLSSSVRMFVLLTLFSYNYFVLGLSLILSYCTFLHEISFLDLWGGNLVQNSFPDFTELSYYFFKYLRTWSLLSEISRFCFLLLLLFGRCPNEWRTFSFIFIVLSTSGVISGWEPWCVTFRITLEQDCCSFTVGPFCLLTSGVGIAHSVPGAMLKLPVMISSDCLLTDLWFSLSQAFQVHHDLSLLSLVQNLIRYGSCNCHFFLTLYSLGFMRFATFLASICVVLVFFQVV